MWKTATWSWLSRKNRSRKKKPREPWGSRGPFEEKVCEKYRSAQQAAGRSDQCAAEKRPGQTDLEAQHGHQSSSTEQQRKQIEAAPFRNIQIQRTECRRMHRPKHVVQGKPRGQVQHNTDNRSGNRRQCCVQHAIVA